jgi:hypothetical protein
MKMLPPELTVLFDLTVFFKREHVWGKRDRFWGG